MEYKFDNSLYTFLISKQRSMIFSHHERIFDNFYLNFTSKTKYFRIKKNLKELLIIGYCVDCYNEIKSSDILDVLLNLQFESISDFCNFCKRFAGKYLIIFKNNKHFFAVTDACNYINLSFSKNQFCLSSHDFFIAKENGNKYDPSSLEIRQASDYSCSMPYNSTIYCNVSHLVPNHYLDLDNMRAVRFSFKVKKKCDKKDTIAILNESYLLVENIFKQYITNFQFKCPLTGGYDSRVIFSFFIKNKIDFECFTFKHNNFKVTDDDLIIPETICELCGVPHVKIPDLEVPKKYYEDFYNFYGGYFSKNTLSLAFTFLERYEGFSLLDSTILDQVGKIPFGKNLPSRFANKIYLSTLFANKNRNAEKYISKMKDEWKKTENIKTWFDLYNIEQRCGRWAAQTQSIYSLCGLNILNMFNCGYLIELWASIPRKYRCKKIIHSNFIERNCPKLSKIPVNPGEKMSLLKENAYFMYFYSILKFKFFKK